MHPTVLTQLGRALTDDRHNDLLPTGFIETVRRERLFILFNKDFGWARHTAIVVVYLALNFFLLCTFEH